MKKVTKMAAQGDVLFRRVSGLPSDAKPLQASDGAYVVAHSETGHHHTVDATGVEWYAHPTDALTSYLRLRPASEGGPAEGVDVVHHRPWDTHETLRLLTQTEGVVYEIRRQREHTPEGWRVVAD